MTSLSSPTSPSARPSGFPRSATPVDADLVTRVLVDAFRNDPMWGAWAFPSARSRRANRQAVFRTFVDGALRYPTTWITRAMPPCAMWIPPGGKDLTRTQEDHLERILADRLGSDQANHVLQSLDQLVEIQPKEPHYYLSLFGTDPGHRGRGIGQALLAHNLSYIDNEGAAAYLDCADELVPLYSRFGFRASGSVILPDGPRSNGMWRPARGSSGS